MVKYSETLRLITESNATILFGAKNIIFVMTYHMFQNCVHRGLWGVFQVGGGQGRGGEEFIWIAWMMKPVIYDLCCTWAMYLECDIDWASRLGLDCLIWTFPLIHWCSQLSDKITTWVVKGIRILKQENVGVYHYAEIKR